MMRGRIVLLLLLISFVVMVYGIDYNMQNILLAEEKKDDVLGARADSYVTETGKIFDETQDNPQERGRRLSAFGIKARKMLSAPFSKTLTKITLINMELTCSAMPNLESAGFASFPQSYILLEVLGKENVDSSQLIKALSNKRNDWKFRWLIAEILGSELYIKESKDAMMEIITDNSENQNLRSECLFMVPAKGETYGGKPIGEYLIQIFREEKELRPMAAMRLGSIKYEPALDILIQSAKEDSLKPIMALGAMGNKRALPVMFDLLKEKKYRAQIAEQMGRIGGSDVMDTLMNLAVKDEDPIVRSCAKMGLAWTDNEKAYEFLIKNHCVETLGRAAWYGRFKALYALKKVGTPKAIKKLKWLSNLEGSGMPDIRNAAKELLKEIEYEKE